MDAKEMSVNIHDHGTTVDGPRKRAMCNYCGKNVSCFSRLKYHLGGVGNDVTSCLQVPEDVKDIFRTELLEKKKRKLSNKVGNQPEHKEEQNLTNGVEETYLPDPKKKQILTNGVGEPSHPNLSLKRKQSSDVAKPNETGIFQSPASSRIQQKTASQLDIKETEPVSSSSKRKVGSIVIGVAKPNETGIFQTAASSRIQQKTPSQSDDTEIEPVSSSFRRKIGSRGDAECLLEKERHKLIGRIFYETGTDFCSANLSSLRMMIDVNLDVGKNKFPTCQDLKGWILQDTLKEVQQYVRKVRDSWESTGCSILLDEWEDSDQKLVNILVDCPNGTIYLCSRDISNIYGKIEEMLSFFNVVLEQVGVKNVVQVVSNSRSDCMKEVGEILSNKQMKFAWTMSVFHCIELMLEQLEMMHRIKNVLLKVKSITRFIYKHPSTLELMRFHCSVRDLVYFSKVRSTRPFLSLQNVVLEKDNLRKMILSSDWKYSTIASEREAERIAGIVTDESFWTEATMALKASIPLVTILHAVNSSNKRITGDIYKTIYQAKQKIRKEYGHDVFQRNPFWQQIDCIWNGYSHLHLVGYFLNPSLFRATDYGAEDLESKFLRVDFMDEDSLIQDVLKLQKEEYWKAMCTLLAGSGVDSTVDVSPEVWWSAHGAQWPELQRVAIRVLSQGCHTASEFELKRGLAEKLVAKGMNPVEYQKLKVLAFVHYNLHLKNRRRTIRLDLGADEFDPMDDWIVYKQENMDKTASEWVETEGPSASNPLEDEPTAINRVNIDGSSASGFPDVESTANEREDMDGPPAANHPEGELPLVRTLLKGKGKIAM